MPPTAFQTSNREDDSPPIAQRRTENHPPLETLLHRQVAPLRRYFVFPCDVDCFDGEQAPTSTASVTTGGRATIFLTVGRHWLRVEHSDASDASVTVTIEP